MEHTLHNKANDIAFFLLPKDRGIRSVSGGIGKNEASEKDIIPRAAGPDG